MDTEVHESGNEDFTVSFHSFSDQAAFRLDNGDSSAIGALSAGL